MAKINPMGFFKKLFGSSGTKKSSSTGGQGLFLYVQCDQCGDKVRLYIHKEHELNHTDSGFVWHKTIIDSKCFQPITTVVNFDRAYNMTHSEIDGGHYISAEEYLAPGNAESAQSP